MRISNNYFAYFFIILSSFTASCCSIHIFLLVSFSFYSAKRWVLLSGSSLQLGPWTHLASKETYAKTYTPQIFLSPTKILLTYLSWKVVPKQSHSDLSFKSHKSCAKALSLWELGPGSSWLNHSYEIHLHIFIRIKIYIPI